MPKRRAAARASPGRSGDRVGRDRRRIAAAGKRGRGEHRAADSEAREDKDVKALVLRVDSPGGSVFASEQILPASTRRAGGRQAGRGVDGRSRGLRRLYIASSADEIWAHPATITGSIGIFVAIPTFEGTLGKIGVSVDGVGTTNLSGQLRLRSPVGRGREEVCMKR